MYIYTVIEAMVLDLKTNIATELGIHASGNTALLM